MVRLRSTQNYACNRHRVMMYRQDGWTHYKILHCEISIKLISLCNWVRFKIGFIYCCTIYKWVADTCRRILSFIIVYLPFCCINTDRMIHVFEFNEQFELFLTNFLLICITYMFSSSWQRIRAIRQLMEDWDVIFFFFLRC